MKSTEGSDADYFRIWQLRSRGWTESMIARFLGDPEWKSSGFGSLSGRVYSCRTVEDVERTPDFERAFLASAKRRRLNESEIGVTLDRIRKLRSRAESEMARADATSSSYTGALNIGQEEHNDWLLHQTPESLSELARRAHDLFNSKVGNEESPGTRTDVVNFDPIEEAMRRHPGLTREEAEEIARAFGF